MFDSISGVYAWFSDAVGGPANSNLVLMGLVALGVAWILLRAVRTGAAIGAASRMVEREKQDPTLLIALRKAEARIMQLEQELELLGRSAPPPPRLVRDPEIDPRRQRYVDVA